MTSTRITRAEIDLQALKDNFDGVKQRVGQDVKIMGIVKANAYGHGVKEISTALSGFGCDYLGVALFEEGIEIRNNEIQLPILVLGTIAENQIGQFLDYNLDI